MRPTRAQGSGPSFSSLTSVQKNLRADGAGRSSLLTQARDGVCKTDAYRNPQTPVGDAGLPHSDPYSCPSAVSSDLAIWSYSKIEDQSSRSYQACSVARCPSVSGFVHSVAKVRFRVAPAPRFLRLGAWAPNTFPRSRTSKPGSAFSRNNGRNRSSSNPPRNQRRRKSPSNRRAAESSAVECGHALN